MNAMVGYGPAPDPNGAMAEGTTATAVSGNPAVASPMELEQRFRALSTAEKGLLVNSITPEVGMIIGKLLGDDYAEVIAMGVQASPQQYAGGDGGGPPGDFNGSLQPSPGAPPQPQTPGPAMPEMGAGMKLGEPMPQMPPTRGTRPPYMDSTDAEAGLRRIKTAVG